MREIRGTEEPSLVAVAAAGLITPWQRCLCEGSSNGPAPILLSCFPAGRFRRSGGRRHRLDFSDIPYVVPANDNSRSEERLSSQCG